jgi:membrane protein
MTLRDTWSLIKEIVVESRRDRVAKLSASMSYLAVFSLAPLLVITVGVAGFVFGQEAARGRIVQEMSGLVGPEGAQLIETLLQRSYTDEAGPLATLLSLVTLFVAATAAFADLQESLNLIWGVEPKSGGNAILRLLQRRLLSFGLVVATGFLLLVSLVVSTAISALRDYLAAQYTIDASVLQLVNIGMSMLVAYVLFLLMYRFLPDVRLHWRDVRTGALVTTVLFVIGKSLIGLYLGRSATASTFGAAASLAILLIWIYYSAQIFFLGAEFTYVYARRYGSGVHPVDAAKKSKPRLRDRRADPDAVAGS